MIVKAAVSPGSCSIQLDRINTPLQPSRFRPRFVEEKCLLIKFVLRLLPCIAFLNLCCLLSAAQQTPPPANSEPSTHTPAQTNSQKKMPESDSPSQGQSKPTPVVPGNTTPQGKVQGTSNDRLFYTRPNFLSLENVATGPPL